MDISKPATDASVSEIQDSSPTQYPVSFTGTGGEYFKIWIVNILLTIVTLYIYSAWAKIRTKRYFHGNTVLDGSSFEYHAKPLQILFSRLVAVVLLIAATAGDIISPWVAGVATGLLFIVIPWAIWRSTKFTMRMTSYRNVRFGFDGSVWPLYLYQFLLPLIAYALIGLSVYVGFKFDFSLPVWIGLGVVLFLGNLWLTAFTHSQLSSYFLNHYLYGKSRFSGTLSANLFYRVYGLATLLGLAVLAVLAAIIFMPMISEGISLSDLFADISTLAEDKDIPDDRQYGMAELGEFLFKLIWGLFAYIFLVGYFVTALVRAKVRNHVFENALLDQRVSFESDVSVLGLWWVMFSNFLLIVVTLGFARPFTQVRMAKYMANHTKAVSAQPLDQFVGEKREEVGAFGDELGDAFDMEMDVGF